MSPDPHGWQSFDPAGESLPPALEEDERDDGEVVVLAVLDDGPDLEPWSLEAVAALARRWAPRTERLFLMDLDLGEPGLHRVLEVENGEGSVDVFLFGSSIRRIARAVDGGAFYFAPAGTATAEPESVLRHDRWDALIQGFRDARARLLLHLPLDLPGSDAVLERADRIVVLGRPDAAAGDRLARIERAGAVLLRPPSTEAAPAEVEADEPGEPEGGVVDIADLAPDDAPAEEAVPAAPPREAAPAGPVEAGDEVVDIADLAPDEAPPGAVPTEAARVSGEMGSEVVDVADLAPDEAAALEEEDRTEAETASETGVTAESPEEPVEAAEEADDSDALPVEEPEVRTPADEDVAAGEGLGLEPVSGDEAVEDEEPVREEEVADEDLADEDLVDEDLVDEDLAEEDLAEEDVAEEEAVGAPDSATGDLQRDGVEAEEEETHEAAEVSDEAPGWEEPAAGDAGAEADDFADFDFGSLDALAEGAEEEPTEEEIRSPSGFGGDEADVAGEAAELDELDAGDGEPSEEPVGATDETVDSGFDGFSGELEGGDDVEEPAEAEEAGADFDAFPGEPEEEGSGAGAAEEEEGGFDFGDYGGELEGPEEEPAPAGGGGEGGGDEIDLAPSFAEQSGGEGDPQEAAAGDFGDDLVTGPDFGGGEPAGEPEEPVKEEAGGEDEIAASGPAAEGPPARTPGPEADAGEGEEAEGGRDATAEPAEEEGGRPGRGGASERPARLVLLLLLVVAGAVAGHWFGYVRVPGLDRALASFLGPAGTGPAPVVETTDPVPSTPVLGYSLGVDAYRDASAAGDVASALRERLPDRLFVVVPVQVDGEVFHRLLAGPARSAAEAGALREPLAAVLTREDPEDWVVRATPLAFLVEETANLQAAGTRSSTLVEQGISAYVLEVAYGDDAVRYRVYAGAYETPEEARAMRGILAQAGVPDVTFTERRGRLPE